MIKNQDYVIGNVRTLKPKSEVAYAWTDRTQPVKRLYLKFGQKVEVLNIDKAMKKKQISLNKYEKLNIEVRVSGNIKRVRITTINNEADKNHQGMFL